MLVRNYSYIAILILVVPVLILFFPMALFGKPSRSLRPPRVTALASDSAIVPYMYQCAYYPTSAC